MEQAEKDPRGPQRFNIKQAEALSALKAVWDMSEHNAYNFAKIFSNFEQETFRETFKSDKEYKCTNDDIKPFISIVDDDNKKLEVLKIKNGEMYTDYGWREKLQKINKTKVAPFELLYLCDYKDQWSEIRQDDGSDSKS